MKMALVERFLAGDRRALAKLITLVEDEDSGVPAYMSAIYSKVGTAYAVGITGPPGAGKSTIADQLVWAWRKAGARVGAILIDPSSPFTGGAILGDRIRMQRHALDEGVFIRSLGTRGSHGGLTRSTRAVSHLLDAFGFERILIETVGVGQTELDIMEVADTTLVILGPESGDTVQTMKAGLMEIADVFVVNKSDRDGASRMVAEIKAMLELAPKDEWTPPVISCQANTGKGVEELDIAISSHRAYLEEHDLKEAHRKQLRKDELTEIVSSRLKAQFLGASQNGELKAIFERVENFEISPYEAADIILKSGLFAK